MKKSIKILLVGLVAVSLCGCASRSVITKQYDEEEMASQEEAMKTEDSENNTNQEDNLSEPTENINGKKAEKGKDTELGLRSIRIHDADNLTEQQKKVAQYFNQNYMRLNGDYEFLQRYPQVFKGAEIKLNGTVKKVLSSDSKSYELLVWVGLNYETMYRCNHNVTGEVYDRFMEETKNNLIVIKGNQSQMRFIEGDEIAIIGNYEDVKDYTIDGTSYHIPEITVNNAYIDDLFDDPIMFDADFIKEVATAIFGENIEIRLGEYEEGLNELDEVYWKQMLNGWYYVCELDNQSNAKFTKYYFLTQYGMLIDAKSNAEIRRLIEFSPDFQHFFLLKGDNQLNTLTLEYYDTDFKKIWSKEFSETVTAAYDFTSTSIYVVVNNDLHILDLETGEENIDPVYIGNKSYVRKLEDGLLMIDETSPSDAIMKTDLNGKILWKINMKENFVLQDGIQVIDDNILISGSGHYLLVNNQTGEVVVDAVSAS